jgi:RNA polymerase sigma-70 factor (sigma-E family)
MPTDPATFEAIYTAEHGRLVRTAALITGSVAAAEDIVQEAFAKLHPRLRRIDNPAAWLHRVVVNAARNDVRHALVRRRFLERQRRPETSVDAPISDLVESLRRLPARQRAVVVLRFYEDRPEAEIARLLGMRLGTVKSTLHRALAALRLEIEP